MSHWPLTVLNSLVSAIQIFLPLIFVRLFSLEQVGDYKIFFLYLGIFPLATFSVGFLQGLYYWSAKKSHGLRLYQQAWALLLVYSTILLTIGLLGSSFFTSHLSWSLERWLAFLVACIVALSSTFFEEASIAHGRIWTGALYRAGFELLRCAAMVGAAYWTRRVEGVMVAHAAVTALKWAVGLVLGYRQQWLRWRWNRPLLKEVIHYVSPVSTSGALSILSNQSDLLVLSRMLGSGSFALYSMGCLAVPPLMMLEQSVNQILIPKLTEALANNRQAEAQRLFRDATTELLKYMVPATVGLVVFADPIVRMLFTEKFIDAVPILRLSSLGYLFCAFPYDATPRATGKVGWTLKVFLVKAIGSIGGVLLLAHWFGVLGALSAALIASVGMRLSGAWFNQKYLGWKIRDYFPSAALIKITLVCLLLAVAAWLIRGFFAQPLHWLFCGGVGFFIIYFLWILKPVGFLTQINFFRFLKKR